MWSLWLSSILLLGLYLFKRLSSPLAKIPGPWYTNFTSFCLKYHEFTATRRLFVHHLHKKYGPVVRLAPSEVSFVTLDAIREIYASGGSGYDKTEYYDLFRQYGIKYAMSNIVRDKHVSAIKERAQAFVSRCAAIEGSVNVYSLLHCYALDGVTNFMFSPGGLKSLDNAKDYEMMEELTYHQSLQKNLLHYYLPRLTPYFPSCLHPRPAPTADAYVLQMAGQQHPDEHSLVARLTRKGSTLNHMQVAAECKDHMAAGIDTTGDALCFLMWELSQPQNLQFQNRLHRELLSASDDTPLDKMPYLDAVIKEALRCTPPIPMSFPRYVPCGGRTIDGYFIPENTIVSCQPYTVHRFNEEVFPEPDRFNPERWLEEKGFNDRNRLFFSFGTGGRGCTGKNLAMVEMKVLLRELYSRFRSSVAPDMIASMDLDDQIISARPKDQICKLIFAVRGEDADAA
ncbi:cytochrome P450 [Aspergillus caelatus]|uniref:Cytochrome P450 n=1 Tax=Aspergillus caelatus TaxID=61420 RepID=A0A5N7AM54_9EURO|nr:cytochrome P450 [Aspergillus caelatus]KAE8370773.1 cytochrome P450 [Aspergillus caelatus]